MLAILREVLMHEVPSPRATIQIDLAALSDQALPHGLNVSDPLDTVEYPPSLDPIRFARGIERCLDKRRCRAAGHDTNHVDPVSEGVFLQVRHRSGAYIELLSVCDHQHSSFVPVKRRTKIQCNRCRSCRRILVYYGYANGCLRWFNRFCFRQC